MKPAEMKKCPAETPGIELDGTYRSARKAYASFLAAAAGWLPVIFFSVAGRLFPKEPLKILPFLVFLSPLPMI
jgi:hypothetical protein